MASPFGPAIMCGPVGVGGEPSSVQLKEAPNVFVSMVTLISCPPGPLPLGGVSVGVAHVVSPLKQADKIITAMAAQIILVSIFICFPFLCERAFRSRLTLREEGQVELRE
jgi:hypothetical protein